MTNQKQKKRPVSSENDLKALGSYSLDEDATKPFRFFKAVEITRIIIPIVLIIVGIVLMLIDKGNVIHIGSIIYKENEVANISINAGALLCVVGATVLVFSGKHFKLGGKK